MSIEQKEVKIKKLLVYCTSQTKYVSNEHGVSFHFRPFPSLFHNSRQFSSSPFSYRKLFGSPAFQFVNVIGRPLAIQKKLPSSAKSVPDVQKCSLPRPEISTWLINRWRASWTCTNPHHSHGCVSLICRSLLAMKYWPSACRGSGSTALIWTSWPGKELRKRFKLITNWLDEESTWEVYKEWKGFVIEKGQQDWLKW